MITRSVCLGVVPVSLEVVAEWLTAPRDATRTPFEAGPSVEIRSGHEGTAVVTGDPAERSYCARLDVDTTPEPAVLLPLIRLLPTSLVIGPWRGRERHFAALPPLSSTVLEPHQALRVAFPSALFPVCPRLAFLLLSPCLFPFLLPFPVVSPFFLFAVLLSLCRLNRLASGCVRISCLREGAFLTPGPGSEKGPT